MNKKLSINLFSFLVSPFLSLPLILKGIYNKEKGALTIFAFFIGLLSYNYIPSFTNDKTYYLEWYERFEFFSTGEFLIYLAFDRTDFFFHVLLYVSAKLGVSFEFITMLISSFTIGVWFYIFSKMSQQNKTTKYYSFLWFLVMLFSFSLGDYLSGMRYYLACSFVLLGFFNGLVYEKKRQGFFLIILAIVTHFSCVVFLPMYFLLRYKADNHKFFLTIFYVSLVFVFIPKAVLLGVLQNLHLPAIFEYKLNAYLAPEDYLDRSVAAGNFNNYIVIFFDKLWVYIAIPYVLLTRDKKSTVRNIFLLSMALVNVLSNAPIVHFRYSIFAQAVWIFTMVYEFSLIKRYFLLLRFLLIFYVLNISMDILTFRENLTKSYFDPNNVSLITNLRKESMKSRELR